MATPPPHGNPRNLSPKTHGDHHHHGNPPPSPPWTHIWPIIKTPPPSTTTTTTPNSTTMNPQKKSIPKSNQTNSKFWIQKMTHKKKIQVKIYTNPTTNRSRHYKPHQKPMNMPLQTTIPRRRIPINPENVPKNTQKSPPYHAAAYPWTQKMYPKIPRNHHHTTPIWLPQSHLHIGPPKAALPQSNLQKPNSRNSKQVEILFDELF